MDVASPGIDIVRMSRYDDIYRAFDSPLAERMRREAYGEDIAQHSWVTAARLREDVRGVAIDAETRWLDLGCGPCGPLTYVAGLAGCRATGLDASHAALISGSARARWLGVATRVDLVFGDADATLPFRDAAFDVVTAYDVVLHLRDRARTFAEVARVLAPGGRFLCTDAGVATGDITDAERAARTLSAPSEFVPEGRNEALLRASGFELARRDDRTGDVIANAAGRLRARRRFAQELARLERADEADRQRRYLETTIALAERRALSRHGYLAVRSP